MNFDTRAVSEACSNSLVKTVSNDSFMDYTYPRSYLLNKSYDSNERITTNWDYDSTTANTPENMFTPYVRLFSETDDERGAGQNESSGLYKLIFSY